MRGEGNSKATVVTKTQREAINKARDIAINQRAEVVIHGVNARIRNKNSYGNDPCHLETRSRLLFRNQSNV